METVSFEDLGLNEQTLAAVAAKGFDTPSPIQVLTIPRLLESDTNIIAKARTGTGKTAAFGLPLVQKITTDAGHPQTLILTPTRELAMQVCREIQSFCTGTYPRLMAIYGGQSMSSQLRELKRGAEIIVGTPGRVKDFINRGALKLDAISHFILDEADEMLDMGFIDDIKYIFEKANPASRVLLFSATMPAPILEIAHKFMGEYEIVEEEEHPEEPILTEQRFWVVRESEKVEALVRLIDISPDFYGLVFTQTKADADSVTRQLDERGYEVAALHGDIAQNQREKILLRFRNKKTRLLIATDVAARGIDIEGLTHVVNYSMPFDVPSYIHRIGRTGRAGAKGLAYTFVRPEECRKLDCLRRAVKKNINAEIKEETIPTIEQVLSVKRERLFEQMKDNLGFTPDSKVDVDESYMKIAETLCENQDPKDVLAAVISLTYGKTLNSDRYGKISSPKSNFGSPSRGISPDGNTRQVRLYVGLGRRDGYNAREVALFFSNLLNIPQRLVDRIDVAESFSLVSLPREAGQDVLERASHDHSLPPMHIDERRGSGRGNGSGRSNSGRSASFGRNNGSGKSNASGRRNAVQPLKTRNSDASLYKLPNKKVNGKTSRKTRHVEY